MPEPETVAVLGCGWLGLPLAGALYAARYRVHGSTRSSERFPALVEAGVFPFRVHLMPDWEGDDPAAFLAADILVLAFPPGRRQPAGFASYPAKMDTVTEKLAGSRVDRVLMVSSTAVYADTGGEVTEEKAGLGDLGASGAAVWQAEERVRAIPGVRATVVRMAGLYGYDRKPGRFLAGREKVAGPRGSVNLIHRDDAVGVLLAVLRLNVWGVALNACADVHPERSAFYTEQARRLDLPAPTFDEAVPFSGKSVSNRRLKEALGYTFHYPDPAQQAP
jgi:nucleoside-diphosphate-sugar epimerase